MSFLIFNQLCKDTNFLFNIQIFFSKFIGFVAERGFLVTRTRICFNPESITPLTLSGLTTWRFTRFSFFCQTATKSMHTSLLCLSVNPLNVLRTLRV